MINITDTLLVQFQSHLLSREASPLTISKYPHDVQLLRRMIGKSISGMRHLTSFKHQLQASGYAARSINSMLSAVNHFMLFCGHPEWKLKFLKLQRTAFCDESAELSQREYLRLVATAQSEGDECFAILLQTICATGIRVSEVHAITVEALRTGLSEVNSKGKIRQILIPRSLCKLLDTYCSKRGIESGCIFVGSKGKPVHRSSIWRRMKKLGASARVLRKKIFPHNLRHLFARCFYKKYKDIVRLADILGHSSIETTRIYTMKNSRGERRRLETLGLITARAT